MLKGFKTVIFGVVIAATPSTLEYLAHVDWTVLGLSPIAGGIIGAAVVGLRYYTNTAIGKKS